MKINLRHVLVSITFFYVCIGQVWALSLGNIYILSKPSDAFEARVNVNLSDQERKAINSLEVKEADAKVYELLGISKVSSQDQFEFKVIPDAGGVPQYIQISSNKPLDNSAVLFRDIVVEVKWPSGLMRRVYTILSDKSKNLVVPEGATLGDIALKMQPDIGGGSFDQALIALYRANPQAFFSGNIHRLKAGEVIRQPSPAMVKSIPLEESRVLADSIYQNFKNGQLNTPTEDSKPIVKANQAEVSIKPSGDRLNIGSASSGDDVSKQLANQMEELVAQEKLLADAKQRIAEIEKNIDDLKKLSSKSAPPEFYKQGGFWLKTLLGVLLMVLVASLTYFSLKKAQQRAITQVDKAAKITLDSNKVEDNFGVSHSPISSDRAKALFSGIDLNLDTPIAKAVDKKLPSVSELRVKLNLAKSYLKIDDLVMAKLIFDEIISSDASVSNEITREARHLRAMIAV
jgi:pilus assembly protein FimV